MDHSPAFLKITEDALSRVSEISVNDAAARARSGDAILIDVREESEWNEGHADGAIHLGKGIIERDIEKRVPDPRQPLLLYCGGGFRSALAADNLQKMGYTDVLSVAGGYKAWVAAGKPVTTRPEIVPRSPYEKVAGIVHLGRMIDKARLYPQGKLPGYNYLTIGWDKILLELLCLDTSFFEKAVRESKTDEEVVSRLKTRLGPGWPGDHAIHDFNEKILRRRPDTPEKIAKFEKDRAALPSTKKKIETYADYIDLEEGRIKE